MSFGRRSARRGARYSRNRGDSDRSPSSASTRYWKSKPYASAAIRVTFGLRKMCVSGRAMNPKTVRSGQVNTRVCRRGSVDDGLAPALEARFVAPSPQRKSYSAFGEDACASADTWMASRNAIFSNEKSRFVRDSIRTARTGDLFERSRREQLPVGRRLERFLPALVRGPFVVALPVDVGLVAETAGEELEEFSSSACGARREGARCADRNSKLLSLLCASPCGLGLGCWP